MGATSRALRSLVKGAGKSSTSSFPVPGNVIYTVDQPGQLLRYVDASQTGGGEVSSPQVIGRGGWQQFRFYSLSAMFCTPFPVEAVPGALQD
jgi:hypothetical protein